LSFHCRCCHRIVVFPSPIVVAVIANVIDVVVVVASAIVVHVTFVVVAILAAILVVGVAAAAASLKTTASSLSLSLFCYVLWYFGTYFGYLLTSPTSLHCDTFPTQQKPYYSISRLCQPIAIIYNHGH
jgi:hypothetical protein